MTNNLDIDKLYNELSAIHNATSNANAYRACCIGSELIARIRELGKAKTINCPECGVIIKVIP